MGHRTVKRVPLDFDAPLNDVWSGYLMPDEVRPPECAACKGSGLSPTARWLHYTFYAHHTSGQDNHWGDKLIQSDVDALIERGRLRHWAKREPTEDNPRTSEWVVVPRTAEEVNEAQRGGSWGHECSLDGISLWIVVKHRCDLLGTPHECQTCNGRGMIATDEEYDAFENWEGSEPPAGEGWQLWETTSEGSPVSPVFATAEALAAWCETGATSFASMTMTKEQWLRGFIEDTTDVDSMLVVTVPRG